MSDNKQDRKADNKTNRKRRGRGEGGIFQRADGLWCASVSAGYNAHGKRKRRTVYGHSKAEVREKLQALHASAARGVLNDADRLTVAEYLPRWLDNTVKPKVAPTTYNRYEQHVRLHLVPHLGKVRLSKLTPLHVEQLYGDMAKAGASASEQAKVGTALRMALRQAVRLQLLAYNPAADVPRPKAQKEEIRPLDLQQVTLFLEAAKSDRLYPLYVLALDSGMRQGELFGLQWPDFDFESGSVQVQRSLEEIKGKLRLKDVKTAKARRRIDLSPFALGVLHEHRKAMLAEGRAAGPVFCDTRGGWLRKSNFARGSFKPALERAGLPDTRFHDLRHTCATLLLLADVNVKIVSERLGHSKIQITLDTYSHVLPTMQKNAAEKLDRIFQAVVPQAAIS
jgi:integrase